MAALQNCISSLALLAVARDADWGKWGASDRV
jgi:hypothetical protein